MLQTRTPKILTDRKRPTANRGKLNLAACRIYFDFDNTISPFDVLDDLISRFAVNKDWLVIEKAWEEGSIDAKTCLEGQLRLIRATREEMEDYLSHIQIDPHFIHLVDLLRSEGSSPVILSDSFSRFIYFILEKNGITDVPVHANEINVTANRWVPSFPYYGKGCAKCAHCKKQHLIKEPNFMTIYIGDGRSDICAAEVADIVFAKGTLLKYMVQNHHACFAFKNLRSVYHTFKEWLHA